MNQRELFNKKYKEVLEHRRTCPKWGKGFCLKCFGNGLTIFCKELLEAKK